MTVYVDVLLFVDVCVDSVLLWVTARLLHLRPGGLRYVGGVALSVVYGLAVLFDEWGFLLSAAVRVGIAALIVFVTFGRARWLVFGKRLFVFLLVSVSYVGLLLACQALVPGASEALFVRNGTVYYDLPLTVLFAAAGVLCAVQMVAERALSRRPSRQETRTCTVALGDKNVTVRCLVDTGNLVRDALSGLPVVILDKKALKPLVPLSETGGLLCPPSSPLYTRLRVVPFRGAGGTEGVLTAFRPDAFCADGTAYRVLVALDEAGLCRDGTYDGILPVLTKESEVV